MHARRRLLKKACALALVGGGLHLTARGGAGSAFAPATAPATTPTLAAAAPAAERDADARLLADALRGAEAAASAREPRLRSGDYFFEKGSEMALDPPWTTCFVEAQMASKSVFEEWIMRGDREVVASFRAWRRSSSEPTGIRCVDSPAEDALQSACLECAALEEAPAQRVPFAIDGRLSARGVMTFVTGSSRCLASTAKGQGFCKSGQVVLG